MSTFTWAGGIPGTYSIADGGNWIGGNAPGTLDVGLFEGDPFAPYTLIGNLTLGAFAVLGDQVSISGNLTGSDLLSPEVSVLGGGTLTIASGGSFTGSRIVQVGSTGSPGLLVLHGALAASDIDVLASGTLKVDAAAALAAGNIFVQSGTLQAINVPGTAAASTVTLTNAVHVLADATMAGIGAAALTLAGDVDGGGSIILAGGMLTLTGTNSYTGGTTINGGTLVAGNSNALGSGPVTLDGGTLLASASATLAEAFSFQGRSALAVANGQTLTLGPASGADSSELSGVITIGAVGAAGTVVFSLGPTGLGDPTYVIQAGTVVEGTSILLGGYTANIAAGATLDLNGHFDNVNTLSGAGLITSSTGGANIQAAGTFDGSFTGPLSLQAVGTLVLTGTNTLSGSVGVSTSSTLQLGNGGTTGSVPGNIADDGTLVFDRSDDIVFNGTITGNGMVVKNGNNTLTLNAANSFTVGLVVNGGTIVAGNASAFGNGGLLLVDSALMVPTTTTLADSFNLVGNTALLAATGQTLDLGPTPSLESNALSGTITIGAPGIAGTVRFDLGPTGFGNPTYLIQAGTVVEGSSALLGGYTANIAAGATLDLNGHTDNVNTLSGSGVITSLSDFANFQAAGTFDGSFTGEISLVAVGNLVLTGTNTPTGSLGVSNSATLQLGNGGTTGSIAGNIADDGILIFNRSDAVAYNGAISGAGQVQKYGNNTLTLNAANSFSGGLIVNGGTIVAGNAGAFGTGGVILASATLLVPTTTTLADAFAFQNGSALLVATGQTLDIGPTPTNESNGFIGTITIGTLGMAGTVRLDMGTTSFGNPTYLIQAGTVVEGTFGLLGGYTANIAAGATLDLNGHTDIVSALSGGGVITSLSDFANFQAAGSFDGAFTGEIILQAVGTLVLTGASTATGNTTVLNGSTLQLGNGGTTGSVTGDIADDGTLVFDRSGAVAFNGAISGAGTVVKQGSGTLDLGSVSSFFGGMTITAGVLELGQPGAAGTGTITLAHGSGQTLRIDGTIMASNAIANFGAGDTIDLPDLAYAASAGAIAVTAGNAGGGNMLEVIAAGGGVLASLSLGESTHGAGEFAISQDSGTGIIITSTLPCFAAGTRLATPLGDVAVEALRQGDTVLAGADGQARRAVRWIGHRAVDCTSHPRPEDVWPIRIAPHAFGPGQPARVLRLSPDHAVLIDGVLIPVRYLVNGTTIAQEPTAAITYFHVELASHDVLCAEGLACESYLDTGNRAAFANGGTVTALHPDFARRIWHSEACAKLVLDGGKLEAARGRLLAHAETLGHALTGDPALHVIVDGRQLHPEIDGSMHRFRLPIRARSVRLISRSAVPAETRTASGDQRRLGVAVSRLLVDRRRLPLDDPRFSSGWHAVERDSGGNAWRWTDGDAGLALAGNNLLEVEVTRSEQYWAAEATASAWGEARQR